MTDARLVTNYEAYRRGLIVGEAAAIHAEDSYVRAKAREDAKAWATPQARAYLLGVARGASRGGFGG